MCPHGETTGLGVMEGQGDREGDNDPEVAAWVRGDVVKARRGTQTISWQNDEWRQVRSSAGTRMPVGLARGHVQQEAGWEMEAETPPGSQ